MPTTLTAAILSAGLLLPSPLTTPQQEAEPPPPAQLAGSTSASDGVLRKGCRRYAYSYEVSTPYEDWTLELSIRDRRGRGVASEALLGPSDARAGTRTYRLCRWATRAGRFTIKGKLTSYDGMDESVIQLPETVFRLRRRS